MNSGLFSARRIGVCGSSRGLSPEAAEFCRALGQRLAQDPLAKIVSGGTKKRESTPEGDFGADWLIVSAAFEVIGPDLASERIVTVVREDPGPTERFHLGAEHRARGKTSEARRISFVRDLDALIAVAGRGGTDQELALAIEHDIPVLSVPTFGGSAEKVWRAYRPDLIKTLRIDEQRAAHWEAPVSCDPAALQRLADEMVEVLFSSLPRRCFVIMPFQDDFDALFDFVITPALKSAGDEPIRLDRLASPGDVKRQIDDGLKNCEYAIAVLDNLRPNVLYELGIAHGRDKPTILINRKGAFVGELQLPFDLSMQQRLEYIKVDAELPDRLHKLIKVFATARR